MSAYLAMMKKAKDSSHLHPLVLDTILLTLIVRGAIAVGDCGRLTFDRYIHSLYTLA